MGGVNLDSGAGRYELSVVSSIYTTKNPRLLAEPSLWEIVHDLCGVIPIYSRESSRHLIEQVFPTLHIQERLSPTLASCSSTRCSHAVFHCLHTECDQIQLLPLPIKERGRTPLHLPSQIVILAHQLGSIVIATVRNVQPASR